MEPMNDPKMDENTVALSGVFAALITPVDQGGSPDASLLAQLIDFVVNAGVDGLCLGGGTAEYPHFSIGDRKQLVDDAARHLDGRLPFITAVGAPTSRNVIELGKHALSRGSLALLLPMPFFFRYTQDDIAAYVRETVLSLDAPCLLYNLPAFANPLEPEMSISLLRSLHNVIGLKDSSGDRGALSTLIGARDRSPFTLMCGSDGVFFEAMEAGWDGSISGIASCCPEVLRALYDHHRAGRRSEARLCQDLLDELVEMVGRLPFPWSIRIAAEARGFPNGPLPYPLSEQRQIQVAELRREYEAWFDLNLPRILSESSNQSR